MESDSDHVLSVFDDNSEDDKNYQPNESDLDSSGKYKSEGY